VRFSVKLSFDSSFSSFFTVPGGLKPPSLALDIDTPVLHHGNDGLIYNCVSIPYTPGVDRNMWVVSDCASNLLPPTFDPQIEMGATLSGFR